jgi:hypothetical protein
MSSLRQVESSDGFVVFPMLEHDTFSQVCVVSHVEQVGACEKYFILNTRVFVCNTVVKYVMEKMLLEVLGGKKSPVSVVPCKK